MNLFLNPWTFQIRKYYFNIVNFVFKSVNVFTHPRTIFNFMNFFQCPGFSFSNLWASVFKIHDFCQIHECLGRPNRHATGKMHCLVGLKHKFFSFLFLVFLFSLICFSPFWNLSKNWNIFVMPKMFIFSNIVHNF